jgi:hypothetical protein
MNELDGTRFGSFFVLLGDGKGLPDRLNNAFGFVVAVDERGATLETCG